jgi:glycosyltransferase involved in cell wall biosynthesis
MHITIFHSHFTSMGGAEVLLATQARWLKSAGHEVRIVALRADAAHCATHVSDLRVESMGLPAGVTKMEALTPAMMPALVERVRPFLHETDVVMAYNYPSAPLVAAAAGAGVRRVWYACEPYRSLYLREANPQAARHVDVTTGRAGDYATRQVARRLTRRRLISTLLPWTARQQRALKEFDGAGVRSLDAVASLSAYGAECVREATGRADVRVVYPMVCFAESAAPRRGLRRHAPQLLVQTRLGIPKNIDTLLRGFALFRATHPRAVLHVVGSGARRNALEKLAAQLAPGSVRFHGFMQTADLDALAATCDVFAFAPVDEPFGMVFPEAASRGLLLVGSDHGGPREILDHGAIGDLCDPFSATSIAVALERTYALTDAEADTRRSAADASVRARFGADVVGRQLESFLRG